MRVREHGRAWEGRARRSKSWAGRLSENLSAELNMWTMGTCADASVVNTYAPTWSNRRSRCCRPETCWLFSGGTKLIKVDLNEAGSWFL